MEGASMNDENKKRPDCLIKKVMGLLFFYFLTRKVSSVKSLALRVYLCGHVNMKDALGVEQLR